MGRLRNISNARTGYGGSAVKGSILYSTLGKRMGGSAGQKIYEAGTTQYYDIGSRLVSPDGRVFRYAKAGGTLVTSYGCENALQTAVTRTYLTVAAAAGATSVTFTVAATDGTCALGGNGDGSITVNALVGGYITIEKVIGNVDNTQTRMITGNTAVAAGGGTMTVTFDDPLAVAVAASAEYATCIFSPYYNVQSSTYGNAQTVGVPCMIAGTGQYLWIQTWGPCWVTTQPRVNTELYDGQVVFRHDGTVDVPQYDDGTVKWAQHAGFVLSNARGGGHSTGGAFIMLQISP